MGVVDGRGVVAGAEGVEELVEEVELGHAEGDPVLLVASRRNEEGVETVYLGGKCGFRVLVHGACFGLRRDAFRLVHVYLVSRNGALISPLKIGKM